MAEKVTFMLLKVDLQCPCCYKKIKKILCKFPQIRDQVYDEKQNLVKITVVCCNPHKIRDKLCCKGAKVIKSIEIVEPPVPKPKEPGKPKPKETVVIPQLPPPEPIPVPAPPIPVPAPVIPVPAPPIPVPAPVIPVPAPPIPVPAPPIPVPAPVIPVPAPVWFCCGQCFDGYGGGPCYHGGYGYRRPVPPPPPPPPCYVNYGYWYSYGKGCYVSRCDYFSEENASGCNIM